ncbi:hypothetical protein EI94DRAFT_1189804 [Lactarius quietus]|nr:hypothetical protein EI94DRAFT_1189804 [Lactarius quietus]
MTALCWLVGDSVLLLLSWLRGCGCMYPFHPHQASLADSQAAGSSVHGTSGNPGQSSESFKFQSSPNRSSNESGSRSNCRASEFSMQDALFPF